MITSLFVDMVPISNCATDALCSRRACGCGLSALTVPFQDRQPGRHRRDAGPRFVDVEGGRLDADHVPPAAERGPELVLADPARPPGPRLAVAEAGQVAAAAGAQRRRQAAHVGSPVL